MREKVEIDPWNQIYVEAFNLLSAARRVSSSGPLPIALGEIGSYLDLVGLRDLDTRLRYLKILQAMDAIWLEMAKRKIEEQREEAHVQADLERRRSARRGRS